MNEQPTELLLEVAGPDALTGTIKQFRSKDGDHYDCVLHLDGSWGSIARLWVLKNRFGLNPLGVTFNHDGYTGGEKHRIKQALERFDVDHVLLTPKRSVRIRMQDCFTQSGTALSAAGALGFTLKVATVYRVPLVILDSEIEMPTELGNGRPGEVRFAGPLLEHVRRQVALEELLDTGLSINDINSYHLPERGEMEAVGLVGVQLEAFMEETLTALAQDLRADFAEEGADADPGAYWIGGPPDFTLQDKKDVPRKETQYNHLAERTTYGHALFEGELRYCSRCCMPETAEGLAFDEMGICQPCRSSEQKMHIDWIEREEKLRSILEKYRSHDGQYDCMVPISGGKDSTFQLYVMTQVYGLKVLASTFSHNWYTETGRYNLWTAINTFDVDHVMFTPRRRVVHKLARKSLYMIGDSCWHCHAGVGAFPLQVAVKFNVGLLIWGESVAENDGRATYEDPIIFDRDYFTKISARYYAEEMTDEDISRFDVNPYILPTLEEVERNAVRGIHLGDYIFWDDERQMEFVRDNFGWREDKVENTYKGYKSVECVMAGVHDYSKFIKRGFGRGTDHAAQDLRAGLVTRDQAFELAKQYDTERPHALDYYLDITGYTEEEFEEILKSKREGPAQELP